MFVAATLSSLTDMGVVLAGGAGQAGALFGKGEFERAAQAVAAYEATIELGLQAQLMQAPPGGRRDAGDAGPVTVSAEAKSGGVFIEVRDQGPGVSDHLLDQLFEPFFRPEASRDRDSGGVGLGLAIVAQIVGRHGGTVMVGDAPSGGAEVGFRLPLADGTVADDIYRSAILEQVELGVAVRMADAGAIDDAIALTAKNAEANPDAPSARQAWVQLRLERTIDTAGVR